MCNFFKKLFRCKGVVSVVNDVEFNNLKDLILSKGSTENSNYYTYNIGGYQMLNKEQIDIILKYNKGFDWTDRIYVEFVGYNIKEDKVLVFAKNCKTGIHEFFSLNAEIYNMLGWKINTNL